MAPSWVFDHSFRAYAKFSEKLTFLIPWYAHVRRIKFKHTFEVGLFGIMKNGIVALIENVCQVWDADLLELFTEEVARRCSVKKIALTNFVKLAKVLRTPFLIEHLQWLFFFKCRAKLIFENAKLFKWFYKKSVLSCCRDLSFAMENLIPKRL